MQPGQPAPAVEQAGAVGGVAAPSDTALVPAHTLDAGAPNDLPVLPQAGGLLTDDLAAIHRLVEALYALETARAPVRRSYVDRAYPLSAGPEEQEPLTVRPYGYTQVAVYVAAGCNLVVRRLGEADINIVVPAAHFVTIQQPGECRVTLKAGDPAILAVFRYSDQVWGTILP